VTTTCYLLSHCSQVSTLDAFRTSSVTYRYTRCCQMDEESSLSPNPSSLSPLSDYEAPIPPFQDAESSFMKRRHVQVVLLDEAPKERTTKRVCSYLFLTMRAEAYGYLVLDRNSTFKDIENALGLGQWAILKANYGPVPYWSNARRQDTIEQTTQTLYAVRILSQAKQPLNYILGVVRKADSDYPLAICEIHLSLVELCINHHHSLSLVANYFHSNYRCRPYS
jgi:hypothetical protein